MQQMEGCLVLASTKVEFNHDNHICRQDLVICMQLVKGLQSEGASQWDVDRRLHNVHGTDTSWTKNTSGQHASLPIEHGDLFAYGQVG